MGNRKTRRHLKSRRSRRRTRRLRQRQQQQQQQQQRGGAGSVASAEEWVRNAKEVMDKKIDNQISTLGELRDDTQLKFPPASDQEDSTKMLFTFYQNGKSHTEDIREVAARVREILREIVSLETSEPLEAITPTKFKESLIAFPKSRAGDDTVQDSLSYLLACENGMRILASMSPLEDAPVEALSSAISTSLLFIWALAVNEVEDPNKPSLFGPGDVEEQMSSESPPAQPTTI